jgi:hypothetical protein
MNITIPRHLQVLREEWLDLVARLEHGIEPALADGPDELALVHAARCMELGTRESKAVTSWMERLTDWMNGPLASALADPTIADGDMRRIASRLSHFADELVERRDTMRQLAEDPAMQTAAPYLDAAYLSLLCQLRDFARQVTDALDMDKLRRHAEQQPATELDLSFTFAPTLNMDRYLAWMDRVRRQWAAPPPALPGPSLPPIPAAAPAPPVRNDPPKKRWLRFKGAIWTLLITGAVIAITIWGGVAILVIVALMILVFAIEYPITFLLMLLFGSN